MRIIRSGEAADALICSLRSASPKLDVGQVDEEGLFEIGVDARRPNSARLEVSATADLCALNWHELINFAEDERPN